MNDAIKLAVKKEDYQFGKLNNTLKDGYAYRHQIMMDPLFWKALGKALGKDWKWLSREWFHCQMEPGTYLSPEKFWRELLTSQT